MFHLERLSQSQRELLQRAVSKYHAKLPGSPAEEFLNSRGLPPEEVAGYRFGYVDDPLPEHEQYRGKLAIPYLRKHPRTGWSCVSIRFRTLEPEGKPKYQSMAGDRPRLYNTEKLTLPYPDVGITEGEIDAVTASLSGLPTVGIPGSQMWQDYWRELFLGYRNVFVFTDGDEPGMKLGHTIATALPNARVITCPPGEDINSLWVTRGPEAVKELWRTNE